LLAQAPKPDSESQASAPVMVYEPAG